ncbi:MAG: VTT domain-containing protein [Nanobdellota archaeon]
MELKNLQFEYNSKGKRREAIIKIILGIFIVLLFISVYFNLFQGTFIGSAIKFIKTQIASRTLSGLFMGSIFGGLFFVYVPLEVIFIFSLKQNFYLWNIIVMMAGLYLSYNIDYYAGIYFSRYATKLVSPKQFYRIKSKINKYGVWLVVLFNSLPLPSQPLTFVCGVFRYDYKKYFIPWAITWIIKLIIIGQFTGMIKNIFNV